MNLKSAQLSRAEAEVLKASENTQQIEQENKPERVKYDRTQRMFEFTAKYLLPPPTKNSQDRP